MATKVRIGRKQKATAGAMALEDCKHLRGVSPLIGDTNEPSGAFSDLFLRHPAD